MTSNVSDSFGAQTPSSLLSQNFQSLSRVELVHTRMKYDRFFSGRRIRCYENKMALMSFYNSGFRLTLPRQGKVSSSNKDEREQF